MTFFFELYLTTGENKDLLIFGDTKAWAFILALGERGYEFLATDLPFTEWILGKFPRTFLLDPAFLEFCYFMNEYFI